MHDHGREFWEEERESGKREFLPFALKWGALLLALLCGFLFMLWRSRSAVDFAVSRIDESTPPRYRVYGVAKSAATGQPVPWPTIADDPTGRAPHFKGEGKFDGTFELMTLAEPHFVVVSVTGFRPAKVQIGKAWYFWMPSGDERIVVALEPE